jgi:outer membrane protein OmpA-like peptidoglycan-associated protein/tetratricopeptide (TPR) repeat protein
MVLTHCSRQQFVEPHESNDIDELERSVDELMFYEKYKDAIPYYMKLDSLTEGENPRYKYKAAYCYYKANVPKDQAVDLLEDIDEEDQEQFGADYYFYLARVYHHTYKFDKAIETYNKFLEVADEDDERIERAKQSIKMTKRGKKLTKDSVNVKIQNLGDKINTNHAEYVPVISADESVMIFTSRRPGNLGGKRDEHGKPDTIAGEYYEDLYITTKENGSWSKPEPLHEINTLGHDAAVALSPSGQRLFIYRSDEERWGNIYECRKTEDGWSQPTKMPAPINSDHWEGSISITDDGETVYFASNRKGGMGGKDIYVSYLKGPNEGSEPENLGSRINTPLDEDGPFIHSDRRTLYFSSTGHNSMGGFDILVSHKVDGEWNEPINLGYPINTPDDDIYFVLSADGNSGYYSSIRKDSYGDKDLYHIDMKEHGESKPEVVTLVKGKVLDQDSNIVPNAVLSVTAPEEKKTRGSYSTGAQTGEYVISVEEGKHLGLAATAPGYSREYDTIRTVANEQYNEIWRTFYLTKTDTMPDTVMTASADTSTGSDTTEPALVQKSDEQTEEQTTTATETASESQTAEHKETTTTSETEETSEGSTTETASDQTTTSAETEKTEKVKTTKVSESSSGSSTATSVRETKVHFGFDQAVLTAQAKARLDSFVAQLSQHPKTKLQVAGHTDSLGPKAYNEYLSKQRAQSVKDYFTAQGIEAERIEVVYFGEEQPAVPNESREKRRKNRRVECQILE